MKNERRGWIILKQTRCTICDHKNGTLRRLIKLLLCVRCNNEQFQRMGNELEIVQIFQKNINDNLSVLLNGRRVNNDSVLLRKYNQTWQK